MDEVSFWDRYFDDLPRFARVIIRSRSTPTLADALSEMWERNLVAVPLAPSVSDVDMNDAAAQTGASLVLDLPRGTEPIAHRLTGTPEDADADGLAYIMFTSGSTGQPKGVMLTRGAVEGNAYQVAQLHRFHPDRPHGTCLPLYHVNALMMSLHGSRLAGSDMYLSGPRDVMRYFHGLHQHHIRTASIVPALIPALLHHRPPWPDSLEYLITAAAPLSSELAQSFYDVYGPRLRQGYGLSEAVNFSFTMPLLSEKEWLREYCDQHPPAGVPLPGTDFELRDGEVYLKTGDVMRGYWKNPDATRDAIGDDGWLRTGDLGELRDGLLVLRGRRTEIINRGGEKLYPLDVERQWRQTGYTGPLAAIPVAHPTLGHDVALIAPGAAAKDLRRLYTAAPVRFTAAATIPILTTSTGKLKRTVMGGVFAAATEDADRYRGLVAYARHIAASITSSEHRPQCARAARIHTAALALLHTGSPPPTVPVVVKTAAHEALDALAEMWPQ